MDVMTQHYRGLLSFVNNRNKGRGGGLEDQKVSLDHCKIHEIMAEYHSSILCPQAKNYAFLTPYTQQIKTKPSCLNSAWSTIIQWLFSNGVSMSVTTKDCEMSNRGKELLLHKYFNTSFKFMIFFIIWE